MLITLEQTTEGGWLVKMTGSVPGTYRGPLCSMDRLFFSPTYEGIVEKLRENLEEFGCVPQRHRVVYRYATEEEITDPSITKYPISEVVGEFAVKEAK